MKSALKTCGILMVVGCAVGWSQRTAEAGGRRGCCCQTTYYTAPAYTAPAAGYTVAPVPINSGVVIHNGGVQGGVERQRYQSAYQAADYQAPPSPGYAPAYVTPVQPYYYNYGTGAYRAPRFQDRPFEEQIRADKKIRGL